MAKTTLFQSSIESIIARAAADIASAVRSELAQQVSKLGATQPALTPPRRRGRPPKAASAAAPAAKPAAAKAPKAKPAKPITSRKPKKGAKFVRRSSSEIDADNAKILAYVKANPGQRSEQIQKGVGFDKPIVAAALQALRDAKKVSMKGVKRAATYTAG